MTIRGLDEWLTGEPPEGPCDVCGKMVDYCLCPECPICKSYGDPNCYVDIEHRPGVEHHGLVRDAEQIAGRKAMDEYIKKEAEMDRAWAEQYAKDLKEEEALAKQEESNEIRARYDRYLEEKKLGAKQRAALRKARKIAGTP